MPLDLAGFRTGPVDSLHAVQETIAPVHERLRVDVLVVLDEIQTALERLVHHAPVVLARQAELRLGRGAQQRAAELVQPLTLDHDSGRRSAKRLHIGQRQPHVLQPHRLQRLEAEHVADDRCRKIGDRTFLEQVQLVGDPREDLRRVVRHRLDFVGLGAVVLAGGQPVGPHHGPRRRRRFARNRGSRFFGIDALLRCDPEQREHIGILRYVVGLPITHLRVLQNPRCVALRTVLDLRVSWSTHQVSPIRSVNRYICMEGMLRKSYHQN